MSFAIPAATRIHRPADRAASGSTGRNGDQLDRCLLIVTADHGVSFRAGHSRRLPDAANLSDIASVPLFIKLPGQTEGRVDDRNVESDRGHPSRQSPKYLKSKLALNRSTWISGLSIENRRPRKTLYFFESAMTILVEPDLPKRLSAVQNGDKPRSLDPAVRLTRSAASHGHDPFTRNGMVVRSTALSILIHQSIPFW